MNFWEIKKKILAQKKFKNDCDKMLIAKLKRIPTQKEIIEFRKTQKL